MRSLLLLFIIVPAVELMLLIEIGRHIGTMPTLALIVVTGIVGASLARWQGLNVLKRLRQETAQGRLPADSLVDGAFILVAGALLITPGVLTDLFGFLCLIPPCRRLMKRFIQRRIQKAVKEGRMQVNVQVGGGFPQGDDDDHPPDQPEIIDVESRTLDD